MARSDTQFKKGHVPANKKEPVVITCAQCNEGFKVCPYRKETAKFCSPKCRATFNNQGENHPGWKGGKPKCVVCGDKVTQYHYTHCGKHYGLSGSNNPRWISDRSLIVKSDKKHLDSHYKGWAKAVKDRDGWKCNISNDDCSGRLEAHHILNWVDYPELRYEVNNGITLCAFHHPQKRKDEERLVSFYQSVVERVN